MKTPSFQEFKETPFYTLSMNQGNKPHKTRHCQRTEAISAVNLKQGERRTGVAV